jgi:hypothetical protein
MAATAEIKIDVLLPYEQDIVGSMRGVTGYAVAIFYRFTYPLIFCIFYRPLLQLHRIPMAVAANLDY